MDTKNPAINWTSQQLSKFDEGKTNKEIALETGFPEYIVCKVRGYLIKNKRLDKKFRFIRRRKDGSTKLHSPVRKSTPKVETVAKPMVGVVSGYTFVVNGTSITLQKAAKKVSIGDKSFTVDF